MKQSNFIRRQNIIYLVFQILSFPKTNLLSFIQNDKPCSPVFARGNVRSILDTTCYYIEALIIAACRVNRGHGTPANLGNYGLHSQESDY